MQDSLRYTIFKTKWGYFGLAGTKYALLRTCLPLSEREKVKSQLLKNLSLLNRQSSIKHPVSTQMSLRAKRSNLTCPQVRDCRARLHLARNDKRESSIEHRASRIENDKSLFKILQEQITAYFEGAYISFGSDIPIILDSLSPFARSVLTACRAVEFGQVVTYSELARKLERPGAARAVGNALAKNPLPLVIPCHRVIRSDGQLGGFSALGGMGTKAKLLKHEHASLTEPATPPSSLLRQ